MVLTAAMETADQASFEVSQGRLQAAVPRVSAGNIAIGMSRGDGGVIVLVLVASQNLLEEVLHVGIVRPHSIGNA